MSHAGLALRRALADKMGLTGGLSRALASPRPLIHDRGRVTAGLACAIADGAEVISDFRVMGDPKELFSAVASVPTTWRTLNEIAVGGSRSLGRITTAVNAARPAAWTGIEARHGALPGVRIADRVLGRVTSIRLDATVTPAHSLQGAGGARFQRQWRHHPPLAGQLRQHRRAAGRDAAPRRGRLEHGDRSPHGAGGLDRGAAVGLPTAADGDQRRGRGQPRADRPPGSAGFLAPADLLAGLDLGAREREASWSRSPCCRRCWDSRRRPAGCGTPASESGSAAAMSTAAAAERELARRGQLQPAQPRRAGRPRASHGS